MAAADAAAADAAALLTKPHLSLTLTFSVSQIEEDLLWSFWISISRSIFRTVNKRISCCHSSNCPGEAGPIPRRALGGMGPDEPGQLCTEEITASFLSVLHSFYSNLSSAMIVGARAQRTIDQSQA